MKTIENINFKGERVIIRVDYNVPFDGDRITDKTRIESSKETIDLILNNGGSVILLTHIGRPKGFETKFSCKLIIKEVSETLGREVLFCDSTIGKEAEKKTKMLKPGEIILMENVRFHTEETEGEIDFAKKLSRLGSVFVNDAFGAAHRAHASTSIIAQFFSKKYFGKLLEKEVASIRKVVNNGKKPVLAIIGGAKISTKITIIESLMNSVTDILIGGGMAYTFIKAQGGSIGESICEKDFCDYSIQLLEKAKARNVNIHLPKDVIIANRFDNNAVRKISKIDKIPAGWQGLDIGPDSIEALKPIVKKSKTILWNGPLGVFEFDNFSNGTVELGIMISEATKKGSFSLVGGGDSVLAVKKFGFSNKMSYVSTGGGAMLESLEGKELPGIKALS
ncbi:MAG: phosphoglycerate kinase [Flavobacteriaceae bacterium TMED116]|jgi:phosphoglycerate kinase|nr:MAG: phosphoglycerate kinase [Flavobacteriaceae bacterium TMED116]|tara:strand:+ start:1452 stop:2630 length:1179 start_codon:yes stop_codon:yes gene_type:complete